MFAPNQKLKDMITKKYLKSKPVVKVTFDVTADAKKVFLAGEFNDWSQDATPMRKSKEGTFRTTLDLEPGKEYQFRYVTGENTWMNDEAADKFVANNLTFEDNSVVTL